MYIQFIISELKKTLRNFYRMTCIPVSIFDTDHEVAYCSDVFPPYCSLVRKTPLGLAQCVKLDEDACRQAVETGKPVTYVCPAGLFETVIPIFVEEKHAGFLIFGQYMIYGRNNDREVEQTSRMLGIPLDDLKKSFELCRRLSDEDVEAVSQLLTVMLDGILAGKLIRVSKDDILNTILSHIASNLNGDLSSNELCRLFHLSHSELYSLFARIDQTPHAYVDKLRMKKAYDLLKNSTLSIQEICDEINFPNYTYFIRKFRNYYDVSPGRVRQMARKGAETETQTKE